MLIHNFYTDLLISIRKLFDEIIFKDHPNYIKEYQFNISNRTFQLNKLDYKTQYELPVALVLLNSSSPTFGQTTKSIQQLPIPDINHQPVLFDKDTNTTLFVHEEETNIDISIQINTESQLQTKEIEFVVSRYLPLNKPIILLKYVSFLEIPRNTLTQLNIDPINHTIYNLYTKYNANTDQLNYHFALAYEPLIKLNSISPSITSTGQRSFSLQIDLTYIQQMPIFIFSNTTKHIESISIHLGDFQPDSISSVDTVRMVNTEISSDPSARISLVLSKNQLEVSDKSKRLIYSEDTKKYTLNLSFDKDFLNVQDVYKLKLINSGAGIVEELEISKDNISILSNLIRLEFEKEDWESKFKPVSELDNLIIIIYKS